MAKGLLAFLFVLIIAGIIGFMNLATKINGGKPMYDENRVEPETPAKIFRDSRR